MKLVVIHILLILQDYNYYSRSDTYYMYLLVEVQCIIILLVIDTVINKSI
jgi:hypothetical protein